MGRKRCRWRICALAADGRSGTTDLEVVAIKGLLILTLLAGGWMASAPVSASTATDGAPPGGAGGAAGPAPEALYASHSNEALTELAAQWDTLDVHQRRALLTEVRQRMAQRGPQGTGVIKIRTERRYGRLIRQSDGRVIRIETQVVHVRPATEAEVLASRSAGFGVGFERRAGSQGTGQSGVVTARSDDAPAGEPAAAPAPVQGDQARPFVTPVLQPVP